MMKTYLVGGAVRDKLLGLAIKDRDWVVVGATVDDMRLRGFRQVGRDFPVFLHKDSGEEYALARTERKAGKGYTGFTVHAAPDVTLEEDLKRRDLTINAIAEAEDGSLIDPYGGCADLEARILRHVSKAFTEDPLRVLRVARFAARFASLGFKVAPETLGLMRKLSESGELEHLVPERVWQETQRALSTSTPARYFEVLQSCGALPQLMPELAPGFDEKATHVHHLESAARLSRAVPVRFAVLCVNLHEAQLSALAQRLRLPNACRELASLVNREQSFFFQSQTALSPIDTLDLLQRCDAFRRGDRFQHFLLACRALTDDDKQAASHADSLLRSLKLARQVDTAAIAAQGYKGQDFARQLDKQRLAAISAGLS